MWSKCSGLGWQNPNPMNCHCFTPSSHNIISPSSWITPCLVLLQCTHTSVSLSDLFWSTVEGLVTPVCHPCHCWLLVNLCQPVIPVYCTEQRIPTGSFVWEILCLLSFPLIVLGPWLCLTLILSPTCSQGHHVYSWVCVPVHHSHLNCWRDPCCFCCCCCSSSSRWSFWGHPRWSSLFWGRGSFWLWRLLKLCWYQGLCHGRYCWRQWWRSSSQAPQSSPKGSQKKPLTEGQIIRKEYMRSKTHTKTLVCRGVNDIVSSYIHHIGCLEVEVTYTNLPKRTPPHKDIAFSRALIIRQHSMSPMPQFPSWGQVPSTKFGSGPLLPKSTSNSWIPSSLSFVKTPLTWTSMDTRALSLCLHTLRNKSMLKHFSHFLHSNIQVHFQAHFIHSSPISSPAKWHQCSSQSPSTHLHIISTHSRSHWHLLSSLPLPTRHWVHSSPWTPPDHSICKGVSGCHDGTGSLAGCNNPNPLVTSRSQGSSSFSLPYLNNWTLPHHLSLFQHPSILTPCSPWTSLLMILFLLKRRSSRDHRTHTWLSGLGLNTTFLHCMMCPFTGSSPPRCPFTPWNPWVTSSPAPVPMSWWLLSLLRPMISIVKIKLFWTWCGTLQPLYSHLRNSSHMGSSLLITMTTWNFSNCSFPLPLLCSHLCASLCLHPSLPSSLCSGIRGNRSENFCAQSPFHRPLHGVQLGQWLHP